jgi:hypothetical protein
MYNGTLDSRILKSQYDFMEKLRIHLHRIRLAIKAIQMRLVENMPVIPLLSNYKPPCLDWQKSSHGSSRFVTSHYL